MLKDSAVLMRPLFFRMLFMRMLLREWRSGQLAMLGVSLVMAVTIVTAISLFADRLQRALVSEARQFIAADLVLESTREVDAQWLQQARAAALTTAQYLQFPTMVYAADEMYLASVKAVSDGYPLAGHLDIATSEGGAAQVATGIPARGEAWVDARILALLHINLGESFHLGEMEFRATRILVRQPDAGSSMYNMNAGVMIALQDVPATGVVQPGSRVQYRYLFAGSEAAITQYRAWVQAHLQQWHKLIGLQDQQPGIAQALDRAGNFLLLSGMLGVLLASLAVGMAAQRYAREHYDPVAIMKVLGATPTAVVRLQLGVLVSLLLGATMVGLLCGWVFHYLFLFALKAYVPQTLPLPGVRAFVYGALTGVVTLAAFAMPPLLSLRKVLPMRVLRRDLADVQRWRGLATIPGVLAIYALAVLYAQNVQIASAVMGGALAAALVMALLAFGLLGASRKLGMRAGTQWRMAMASLQRYRVYSILQMVVFGLTLTLLLTLLLLRTSLLEEWRMQLPPETPNHFLINIAPEAVPVIDKLLSDNQLHSAGLFPMVRGRLVQINGQRATDIVPESVQEVYRELNLTWSDTLPEGNVLTAGQWWNESNRAGGVSIEKGLANRLHVQVGDTLVFSINDRELTTRLASVRELDWNSMRPNFFFVFPAGALDDLPNTWITSFYLPAARKVFLNQLLHAFPTVTILEVDQLIAQVHSIVTQVTLAVEVVLMLVLCAGVIVLIASLQSSLDIRAQENAVLRALGASRRLLLGSLGIEFALLGLSAGLLAAIGSECAVWALQTFAFRMQWQAHPWLLVYGPMAGLVLVSVPGLWMTRRVVTVPPWQVLREN